MTVFSMEYDAVHEKTVRSILDILRLRNKKPLCDSLTNERESYYRLLEDDVVAGWKPPGTLSAIKNTRTKRIRG